MTIVEYTLESNIIPSYIIDGGYWMNPDGSEKMIGIGNENSIPDSLTKFTLEGLQARQRAIHAVYPMEKYNLNMETKIELTDDEVNTTIKEWVDARN